VTREELEAELVGVDAALTRIGGCSDGYCNITGKARGQHTNGGCRCVKDMSARRALTMLQQLREKVRTYIKTAET
jgi:hypothetical protein